MPDTVNKQTLINLLIDSPLREPIKINLIDIVNNTTEPDLPKVYPTIVKELEIFQKATERRMKLADETIAKLGGTTPATPAPTNPLPQPTAPSLPPLDLPPLPQPSQDAPAPAAAPMPPLPTPPAPPLTSQPLSVPPLDLPPLPTVPPAPTPTPPAPTPDVSAATQPPTAPLEPLGGPANTTSSDEAALAEIQKELESLKAGVASDANPSPTPAPQA